MKGNVRDFWGGGGGGGEGGSLSHTHLFGVGDGVMPGTFVVVKVKNRRHCRIQKKSK